MISTNNKNINERLCRPTQMLICNKVVNRKVSSRVLKRQFKVIVYKAHARCSRSADRLDLLLFATIPADENMHSTGTDDADADRCSHNR